MDLNVSLLKDWTVPRELTGALPRKTLAKGAGSLVVWILLVLVNSVWLLFDLREATQETARTAALRRESSRETTGKVTRVWTTRGGKPSIVSYAFTDNGVAFTGECFFLPRSARIRRGDTLPIRFLYSNPSINHPAGWEGPESDWWVVPCVTWMVVLLVGIWLICLSRRDRQLVAEGVPTPGIVLSCSRWGRLRTTVRYQFRMPDGRVAEGSSYLPRQEIGSIVCVLYLPQNPRRNNVYAALGHSVAP